MEPNPNTGITTQSPPLHAWGPSRAPPPAGSACWLVFTNTGARSPICLQGFNQLPNTRQTHTHTRVRSSHQPCPVAERSAGRHLGVTHEASRGERTHLPAGQKRVNSSMTHTGPCGTRTGREAPGPCRRAQTQPGSQPWLSCCFLSLRRQQNSFLVVSPKQNRI